MTSGPQTATSRVAQAGAVWRSERFRRLAAWLAAAAGVLLGLPAATDMLEVQGATVLLVAVLGGVPLIAMFVAPLWGWLLSAAGALLIVMSFTTVEGFVWAWPVPHGVALLVLTFAAARAGRLVLSLPIVAVTALMFGAFSATDVGAGWAAAVIVIGAAGIVLHLRDTFRGRLERTEELTEVEKARRAVLEERTRIARDLHDVVAHRMSLVVVQAETAPYRVPDLSPRARDELAAIAGTAREALTEMRALLGVLRNSTDQRALAPQPGLADLPALYGETRRAGTVLDVFEAGVPPIVPITVQQSAYRIVQESLANAARHAPGAQVVVRITYEAGVLHLRIENEPSPAAAAPAGSPGHGLLGMRERAAAVQGSFAAGPRPDGGFTVTAELPLRPSVQDGPS
jgi:signal transduction histidine kinase